MLVVLLEDVILDFGLPLGVLAMKVSFRVAHENI